MIHKQILKLTDVQEIVIPDNAIILSVKNQNGNLCVWYQYDDTSENCKTFQKVTILIVGTGNPKPNAENTYFIDTVIMGSSVWHIFWDQTELHDEICLVHKGGECNCPSAAFNQKGK